MMDSNYKLLSKIVFLYKYGWDQFNIPYYLEREFPQKRVRELIDMGEYTDIGFIISFNHKKARHTEIKDHVILVYT